MSYVEPLPHRLRVASFDTIPSDPLVRVHIEEGRNVTLKPFRCELNEDDGVGPPPHGRRERPGIGNTVGTLNNGLTVKNCRFARKVAGSKDDRGIAVGPIVPVAG